METESSEKKYKIGEVCRMADLQPYVLRYWETEFPPLAPGKSGGGQRLYTQREVDIILRIKQLLYSEGFTIAGAKKNLEAELRGEAVQTEAPVPVQAARPSPSPRPAVAARPSSADDATIARLKKELREILEILDQRRDQ